MVDLCNDLLSIKEGQKKEFTLHSGNKVSFIKAKIPHKRIQDLTFVNQNECTRSRIPNRRIISRYHKNYKATTILPCNRKGD